MKRRRTNAGLALGLLSIVPLLLAPKGCDALVGYDRVSCGGLAGTPCPADQFCDFPPAAMCGTADRQGVCRPVPAQCTEQYEPVCGCDARTHDNACAAHRAGVSVVSDGECGSDRGTPCGGLTGAACAADQFCNFSIDALCGFADATGICEPRPDGCDDSVMVVCGCDGYPYVSACEANRVGVSVASPEHCGGEGGGERCGGLTGAQCPADQFCDFPADALCGHADATGTCAPIPASCTADGDGVCGCNGTTYQNACSANQAGISVEHEGPCL